jgi:L-aminopeptidase/D-esterase-like protein
MSKCVNLWRCLSLAVISVLCASVASLEVYGQAPSAVPQKARARDLGIPFDGVPGRFNAITDVKGVEIGHTTLISGEGKLVVGKGPIRTGVTAILPRGRKYDRVFAGWFSLNGNGELTGTTWVEESGFFEGPITITNTHSVGIVRDSVIGWQYENKFYDPVEGLAALPVVGETYDGYLNDMCGFHVKKEHVFAALNNAASGPVAEGGVGGGTGMICHQFKGGIGTSSRVLSQDDGGYTVGVLVQANHGKRKTLMFAGVPVGKEITDLMPIIHEDDPPKKDGSIIVIVATDAPLVPHQLKRLAKHVPMGIARVGGMALDSSGEIFLAFSTANPGIYAAKGVARAEMLPNEKMDPLFEATVLATEEAIVNAMVGAETMVGINGNTAFAIPHDRLKEVLAKCNRLNRLSQEGKQ